jgi:CubicO group peptidase (beta-lactamase class C family)
MNFHHNVSRQSIGVVLLSLALAGHFGCVVSQRTDSPEPTQGTTSALSGDASSDALNLPDGWNSVPARAAVDGVFPPPAQWILTPGNVNPGPDGGASSDGAVVWQYALSDGGVPPSPTWMDPDYDASSWAKGVGGFGSAPGNGVYSPQDVVSTLWPANANDIWLRTTFDVTDAGAIPNLYFYGRWDNHLEIYVNGTADMSAPAVDAGDLETELNVTLGYRYLGLGPAQAAVHAGAPNVLAVHVEPVLVPPTPARYFDLGITTNASYANMPSAGFENTPALVPLTQAVQAFMVLHGITSGALAVMKNDALVVKRALGWTDKTFSAPLSEDAVFRLASNDKVLTRGAVQAMLASQPKAPDGTSITMYTPVFPLLRQYGLTPMPNGAQHDPNIDNITIGNLFCMTSGLQDVPEPPTPFYPAFNDDAGAWTTEENDVQWVYSQLLTPPGFQPPPTDAGATTKYSYSSSSYMVLRYLVEVVENQDILTYLRNVVLAPAGTSDVYLAHEVLGYRQPSEPWYATLETPYNRWVLLEDYTALASTAEAFVRYLRHYDIATGNPMIDAGVWSPSPDIWCGVSVPDAYDGEMSGTWTSTEQDGTQVNFAVFFNEDTVSWPLRVQLESIATNLTAADWGLTQINAGGSAISTFAADEDFMGGSTINHANSINLTGVVDPAPMAAYQTARIGNFTYTIPGYTAGSSHTVRLHFAETYFSTAGSRVFNVTINGATVLSQFDVYKAAGAKNTAVIETFTANANSSGQYVIAFTSVVNNSLVSAIEVQ